MAITDVLGAIKDHFINWHTEKYTELHTKETNLITNQSPEKDYLVYSSAVKAANDAMTQEYTNADTNLQNQITTNANSINTINGKLQTASYGNMPDVVAQSRTYWDNKDNGSNISGRGFNFPSLPLDAHNGFLTSGEKLDIHYFGKWYELSGKEAGFDSKHRDYFRVWINIGLRLVFLSFQHAKCPWLKNKTEYMAVPFTDQADPMWQVLPVRNVWAPTNGNLIRMGFTPAGEFYLRSTQKVTVNTTSINGTLMWFYRDGPPSSKIGRYP